MGKDPFTRILVVEDDADDRFMLYRQLEKAQLEDHATFIDNGRKALMFLSETEMAPLAVFLDLRLPDINGIQLLEEMRGTPRFRDVPVIVMTGSINPKDREACAKLGVTAFLSKPVDLATFIKTVTHLFPERSERK